MICSMLVGSWSTFWYFDTCEQVHCCDMRSIAAIQRTTIAGKISTRPSWGHWFGAYYREATNIHPVSFFREAKRFLIVVGRIALRVAACGCCGSDLRAVEQAPVADRQVIDLPPIAPQIVEAVVHRVRCPGCGQEQTATFPTAFTAPVRLGPGSSRW